MNRKTNLKNTNIEMKQPTFREDENETDEDNSATKPQGVGSE